MGELQPLAIVMDASGLERVRLLYRTRSTAGSDSKGLDFDSIIWEALDGGDWKEKLRITEAEFEENSERERWPSQIYSFDAASGTLIVQVAEGDAPRDSARVNYRYSWRRWDLRSNKELDYYYECGNNNLFDPYDSNR